MPRLKRARADATLPQKAKFTIVTGDAVIRMERAAKLAGVHPVVLEMGTKLIEGWRPTERKGVGAVFDLGDKDMQERGDDMLAMMLAGLRKVVRALGSGAVRAAGHRDGQRLCFFLRASAAPWSKAKKAGA